MRAVRLDDASVAKILDALDAACTPGAQERRRHARYRYRTRGCVVHMQQPQDCSAIAYLVPTRDISTSGLSFLHSNYVHLGTPCLAELLTKDGQQRRVLGNVVRCRLISGTLHEVGVRFIEDVSTDDFTNAGRHSMLFGGDADQATRPFRLTLDQLGCDVRWAAGDDAILAAAAEAPPEIIMLDADAPPVDAECTTATLRASGFAGMVVVCGRELKAPQRKAYVLAGADRCLGNPPGRTSIYALLMALRHSPISPRKNGLGADPRAVAAYLDHLLVRLHDAELALPAGLWDWLTACAADIKARGASYGYPSISELGAQFEVALDDAHTRRNIGPILATLWDRCLRARLGLRSIAP